EARSIAAARAAAAARATATAVAPAATATAAAATAAAAEHRENLQEEPQDLAETGRDDRADDHEQHEADADHDPRGRHVLVLTGRVGRRRRERRIGRQGGGDRVRAGVEALVELALGEQRRHV